jgi:hypothetical protein
MVLDFLAFEAGKGDASAGMLAELRRECEREREAALRAFAGVHARQAETAKRRRAEAEAAEHLAAETQIQRAREARAAGRVPECLRDVVGERRERLRAAALAVIAGTKS